MHTMNSKKDFKTVLTEKAKSKERSQNVAGLFKECIKAYFLPKEVFLAVLGIILITLPFKIPSVLYYEFSGKTITVFGTVIDIGILCATGVFFIEIIIGITFFIFIKKKQNRFFFTFTKVTEDGIKYVIKNGQVHITGSKKNSSFTQIPSYINDLPVTVIENLQESSLSGTIRIPGNIKEICHHALAFNKHVTQFIVPDTVTELGESAFSDCPSLEEIDFDDNIKSLPQGIVRGCSKLKRIHFPAYLQEIPECCCGDCTSLERIDLPQEVKSIGDFAFYYCENLQTVNLPQGIEFIGESALYGTPLEQDS